MFAGELDDFENLVAAIGATARYASLLRTWRFYCQTWSDYRERRASFVDYPDYLRQVHPQHPEVLRAVLPELRRAGEWTRVFEATTVLLREAPVDSPERWSWLSSRAAAALALGQRSAADSDIAELAQSPDPAWRRRARELKTGQVK